MKMNHFIYGFMFLFMFIFIACNKEDNSLTNASVDEYAEEVIFRTQESTNMGRFGCYELVFPVTIVFPDAFTKSVNSYKEMKEVLVEWRKETPRVRTKPSLLFPYEVVNENGEVIAVENQEEQRTLRIECLKNFFSTNNPKGFGDRPKLCFKPVYPFELIFPNGTTIKMVNGESRKLLYGILKDLKKNDIKVRPQFVYPIIVELEDGTKVEVKNKDELKALIQSCK